MRLKTIFSVVGLILCCMGLAILLPVACAVYYEESGILTQLLIAMSIVVSAGIALRFAGFGAYAEDLSHREGLVVVGIGWMLGCVAGALPYLLTGTLTSLPDAIFESVSGFTTTGATVFANVEILPKSILLWRALTHWMGGMGIIVLFLAILPFLGVGGMQLYLAEVSGPMGDKLKPRIKDTAASLIRVYLLLTGILFLLLLAGGMGFFDSVCHTFAAIASGGFANWNASIAHYNSPYIEWVLIIFMYLTGASYALHYHLFIKGRVRHVLKDSELRLYTVTLLIAGLAIAAYVHIYNNAGGGWEESIRSSFFQVTSIASTTGFATVDYLNWHGLPQLILVLLMFIGGCGGSTAGGLKYMRILLLLKGAYHELFRIVHPRAVRRMKLGNTVVQQDVLLAVSRYLVIFLGLYVFFSLILAGMGLDLTTALSSVIACLSCVGPGLGLVGPASNYSVLPDAAKWVLSLAMLLGRLETYAILLLFMPEFWRK